MSMKRSAGVPQKDLSGLLYSSPLGDAKKMLVLWNPYARRSFVLTV